MHAGPVCRVLFPNGVELQKDVRHVFKASRYLNDRHPIAGT
jgi:hypothetical protein